MQGSTRKPTKQQCMFLQSCENLPPYFPSWCFCTCWISSPTENPPTALESILILLYFVTAHFIVSPAPGWPQKGSMQTDSDFDQYSDSEEVSDASMDADDDDYFDTTADTHQRKVRGLQGRIAVPLLLHGLPSKVRPTHTSSCCSCRPSTWYSQGLTSAGGSRRSLTQ